MDGVRDWLDDGRQGDPLPALRDPFAADEESAAAAAPSGPFALPPLHHGSGLTPLQTATAVEAPPPPAQTASATAKVPFSLDRPDPQNPFQLPASEHLETDFSQRWLAEHDPATRLEPLAQAALAPLQFTLDQSAPAEDTGFALDPAGTLDAITGAGFLARSEQTLRHGGFSPRPAGSRQRPTLALEAEAADARRSGISERPTARHPRPPTAASGSGEAPTGRLGPGRTVHDSWDGTEGTIITPPSGRHRDDDGWDGAEGTIITPPSGRRSDADGWDGAEGTMITPPPDADDWDAGATRVGPAPDQSGRASPERVPWVGTEATVPFATGGRPAAEGEAEDWLGADQTAPGLTTPTADPVDSPTRATLVPGRHTPPTLFSTSRATRPVTPDRSGEGSDSGHSTSTGFDAQWHLSGRHGPSTGQLWGDYEIGGIIGEGGMGLVYRALQKSLGRRCAVKVLSAHLANNQQLLERFELEARAAGTMRSHNVVAVYAAGNIEGQPYYVMEYVEGTDLDVIVKAKRAANERFTIDQATEYVLQAARGLVEAGSHGIVHRDIKPPNLMVTPKGEVKITDFGIVKVQGEAGLTLTGQAMGTPAYLSPEQGRGESVDQRSDLYSLGVVYYELLTMHRPFVGNSADALIYQHSFAEPKLPKEHRGDIPEDIQAVCIKLLAKKPENRYQSAKDLVRDLEDFTEGKRLEALLQHKLSTGGAEALREKQTWIQRNLLWVAGTMVALALVLVGGVAYLNHQETQRLEREAAQQREADNQREEAQTLRTELTNVLTKPEPIDPQTANDLARLESILTRFPRIKQAGEDERIARWHQKIERVGQLRVALEPITVETSWDHALLSQARHDLDELLSLVGPAGHGVDAWSELVTAGEDHLRQLHAELDAVIAGDTWALSVEHRETTVRPRVEELAPLVPADDARLASYRSWLQRHASDERALRERLDRVIGRNRDADTAAYLAEVKLDLARADRLFGRTDESVRNWRSAVRGDIDAWEQALEEVRATFADLELARKIDQPDIQPLRSQVDLLEKLEALAGSELERYHRVLLAADDRWARIREAEAQIRPRLRRVLDHPQPITDAVRDDLRNLQDLLGVDYDPELKSWRIKLESVDDVLRPALDEAIGERLVVAQLDRAFYRLKQLQQLVGPQAPSVRHYARRLDLLFGPSRPTWATDFGRDEFGVHASCELASGSLLRFRYIPPGRGLLGSPEGEAGRDSDESQLEYTLEHAYWLAETELTQAAWLELMGENPSRRTSRSHSLQRPVNRVHLADIARFLQLVAASRQRRDLPPAPLRLPGEHEWEFACRAGSSTPYSHLSLDEDQGPLPIEAFAWYHSVSNGHAHPVAGRRPNPLGLYDLHGNVWEWCASPYATYQVLAADQFRSRESDQYTARGGSWGDPPAALRSANRLAVPAGLRSAYLGLRLAADVDWDRVPDGSRILDRATPPLHSSASAGAKAAAEAEQAALDAEMQIGTTDDEVSGQPATPTGPAEPDNTPVRPASDPTTMLPAMELPQPESSPDPALPERSQPSAEAADPAQAEPGTGRPAATTGAEAAVDSRAADGGMDPGIRPDPAAGPEADADPTPAGPLP